MKNLRKSITSRARRVVVKVGSAVLSGDERIFDRLAAEVRALRAAGLDVAIVSSGAVSTGMKRLGMKARPSTIPERQAVAAAGQSSLMALYDKAFSAVGEKTAQVLLTHDDLGSRKRFLNARNTLSSLFGFGITPVINENDTVAVEEIKFGDNDALSALATNLVEADLLIILSDIAGLYDCDPRAHKDACLIPYVEDVDAFDLSTLTTAPSALGAGGIRSKCEAARKAAHFGVATIIADGFSEGIIARLMSGAEEGTMFLPREDRLTSKKHWIAFSARPTGRLYVDEGARTALTERNRSLLPSGILRVDGTFEAGEVVHIHAEGDHGMELARGVTNYSSREIERIKGLKSAEIEAALGYRVYDEVVHRDNLVVL